MQPQTLRGIFPERKPAPRKNFIKENVRRLRQMQQNDPNKQPTSEPKLGASERITQQQRNIGQNVNPKVGDAGARRGGPGIRGLEIRPMVKAKSQVGEKLTDRIVHRGVQTENNENIDVLYSTGTIRYPSPSILATLNKNRRNLSNRNEFGRGDSPENRANKIDYIKRNMNVKAKSNDKDQKINHNVPPVNYKRGAVPKYIKQRRDVITEEAGDMDCPAGHVLLPDDERKETLRVLRESYAEKIQELNSMPVRSDTLRMQRRKLEIEEELKKIDEGIKVFQRPKVFVKINV